MWARSRQESRKKDYKSSLSAEEARRKREETAVRVRRSKRNDQLAKKRNITPGLGVSPSAGGGKVDPAIAHKLENLPRMVAGVNSADRREQLERTTEFRKLLSIERNPPIEQVIACGVVPRFVQFLTVGDMPQLQFEAAWALTNIASGSADQTRVVIEAGSVPIFVKLLSSPNDEVREQAVWALGNIAGDSPQCRDFVLQNMAMGPLLQNLIESSKLSMLRNATWTLSNFCRGKPQPPFDLVSPALPTLARLIYSVDEEVLTDACWALSYLSDGSNDKIQAVIEAGVCRRMVELLMHTSYSVKTPALRTVGNIVTGDDLQTQMIINVAALPCLLSLLGSSKKGIKKEACWTVSNITAGNRAQIELVKEANIFPPLIELLTYAEFEIQKEAAWAISNATSGGSPEIIRYLVSIGCIKPLCELLKHVSDARIVTVALEGLENILKVGEADSMATGGRNTYADEIEEHDGLDKIESLQMHQNLDIYEKAVKILETYFAAEEEDQHVAPAVDARAGTFSFEAPTAASQNPGGFTFSF